MNYYRMIRLKENGHYGGYAQMLSIIDSYPHNSDILSLGTVVEALEDSLVALDQTDSEWIARFQSEWWTLEEVYSMVLIEQKERLEQEEMVWVSTALAQMKALLQEKHPQHPPQYSSPYLDARSTTNLGDQHMFTTR